MYEETIYKNLKKPVSKSTHILHFSPVKSFIWSLILTLIVDSRVKWNFSRGENNWFQCLSSVFIPSEQLLVQSSSHVTISFSMNCESEEIFYFFIFQLVKNGVNFSRSEKPKTSDFTSSYRFILIVQLNKIVTNAENFSKVHFTIARKTLGKHCYQFFSLVRISLHPNCESPLRGVHDHVEKKIIFGYIS